MAPGPADQMLDVGAVAHPPGSQWCRAWTDQVDAALRGWLDAHEARDGVAVVALGGYARRELCRGSDVDLLLLHDGWPNADLSALVEALCYPLWDAGLAVGYAVRTAKDAVSAAGQRVEDATALTDRRLVGGAGNLADDLAARTARWLRRDGRGFLRVLAEADNARHRAAGPQPGRLEPDLKHGAGGLRDLHSLRWAAAGLVGEVGLDPLVAAGYLGAAERQALAAAGTELLTARCALQLVAPAGRPGAAERLRLDVQDEVAARLDLPAGHDGGDELLRRVGLAMRTIAHLHGRIWPVLLADARGVRRRRRTPPVTVAAGIGLGDGGIEITDDATLADEPALGLRAVAAAAQRGVHLGRATTTRLRREVTAAGDLAWDEQARACLLTVLAAGQDGVAALADADAVGLLTAYLPEWPRVRGHPQRNPLHRFDLDTHGHQAVVELRRIADGELDPGHRAIWERLADPDALLLGAWLHDIGKAWATSTGVDHSTAGEAVARDWLEHMGFDGERADRCARLVRLHLLLPDVATHRDLEDPVELARTASAVGDVELLDALYLLSLADSRATGPAAHSPWKDGLLATLHARVRVVLLAGGDASGVLDDEATIGAHVRMRAAEVGLGDAAAVLLDAAPDRYLPASGVEQALAHARLLAAGAGHARPRAEIAVGQTGDTLVLALVAADRRGLVADCAGVLAGHDVEVLDARAFTSGDGLALDWFTCRAREGTDWDSLVAVLAEAAAGTTDVAAMVARMQRRRDVRPPALARPVDVRVSSEPTAEGERIDVHAPDTPGLLYRLARALADAGFDLTAARVATLGPEARDVFFTRPPSAIDRRALLAALHAAATPPTAS